VSTVDPAIVRERFIRSQGRAYVDGMPVEVDEP
jgi:hypothetical protein